MTVSLDVVLVTVYEIEGVSVGLSCQHVFIPGPHVSLKAVAQERHAVDSEQVAQPQSFFILGSHGKAELRFTVQQDRYSS